jgi:hypothetical protein
MGNLGDLSRELRRIYQRYGQHTQTSRGVPLYLTEYGYQTRPDPYAPSFSLQAAYINQAEYIAARNPNVRTLSQFLLVDDAPVAGVSTKTNPQLAWRTFQSGLTLLSGKRKPSYKAYITPLFLKNPRVRRGTAVRLFGMLRAADATTRPAVSIQWRSKHGRRRPAPLLQHERARARQRLRAPTLDQRRAGARQPRRGRHRHALSRRRRARRAGRRGRPSRAR